MDHDEFDSSGNEDSADECYSDDDGMEVESSQTDADMEASVPVEFQVLAQGQLMSEMNRIADETASVIGLPVQLCKIGLHHYKWNKETLVEKFYESESPEDFFKKFDCGFPLDLNFVGVPKPGGSGLCLICYDECTLSGLTCEHKYCSDCWDSYMVTRIREFPDPFLKCPEPNCNKVVDDECGMLLINRKVDKSFYQRSLINSFVACNSQLKWCPNPRCAKVVKMRQPQCCPVTCDCDLVFCFACSHEWHEPIDCLFLTKWDKKCHDDSETSNWLITHTKDCPKCHTAIEKNGGCNHMTCRSQSCKFEFCWICLGNWPHSGSYSCNRFVENVDKEASRAALERYLHYYNRYANHKNSLKLENRLVDQILVKVGQMESLSFSWAETQFLSTAVKTLNRCRRTLMYTYAFAYFLQANNYTSIFEDNQSDLEIATEQLSEILEAEIDPALDDLVTLKQRIQDKCRYVDQRRLVLLKHCTEGREQKKWFFRDDSETKSMQMR